MENKPKPTLQAIQMKREQNDVQEKQIIALLDQKRELHEAIDQTDRDLEFIGYHPPMMAPMPEKLTEEEWRDKVVLKNGSVIIGKSAWNSQRLRESQLEGELEILKKKFDKMNYSFQKLLYKNSQGKKKKAVKKTSKKK